MMESKPIRMQLGKILWEILAGKSCGKRRRGKANLRKAVIGGNLAFWIGWWGANQSGSSSGKSWRKSLWENLAGKSCEKLLQKNFVENHCGKILWEILAGKSCRKSLQKNLVENHCGKILWEILAGKSCRKSLQKNLVGKEGGEKDNLRKAVIGGNLAFWIGWWGANQSGSSLGKSREKFLQEILAGNPCRKILWEILAGNPSGIIFGKILGEILAIYPCGKILWEKKEGKKPI